MGKMNLEQIEKRIAELQIEIDNATDETKLNEIKAEFSDLEARKAEIAMEERKASMKEVIAGAGKVVEKATEKKEQIDVRNSAAYINAYANYIKSGDDRECRSLLTTNASGYVPVPELVDNIVRTAWEKDMILSRVRKTNFKGNLKVAFEISATDAAVHTEGTSAPSEESLVLGIVTMIPANIKKWIQISDEVVAMGGESFLRYVYDELTYKIVKKLSALVVGDIVAATTSGSSTAPKIAKITEAPSLTAITNAYSNLSDEATENVVIMNKQTYATFRAAQAAGNYNFDPFMDLPVLFSSALPAYSSADTNAVYALVGDLKAEQVNYPEGEGVVLKYDDLTNAEADMVKIVGRQYAAHALTAPMRFCQIAKPAATT